MGHILVVERHMAPGSRWRGQNIREVVENAGHTVTVLESPLEVVPFLLQGSAWVDAVVLSWDHPWGWTFQVVEEMCGIPELRELRKVLVFPQTAEVREHEQMYGARGYADLQPLLPNTLVVCERNMKPLNEALRVLGLPGGNGGDGVG